jgi:hypothetical protein
MPYCDGPCEAAPKVDLLADENFRAIAEQYYASTMRSIAADLTQTNHLGFAFGFGERGESLQCFCKEKLKEAGYMVADNYGWAVDGYVLHVFGEKWDPANPECPPAPTWLDRLCSGPVIMPEGWNRELG